MSILIKNSQDIKKLIIASKIAVDVLSYISKYVKVGVSTYDLDILCYKRIVQKHNAYPATLGYMGFTKSICTSINNVVCHGIPNKQDILQYGDIINIDVGILKDDFYSDMSRMYFVGVPNLVALNLCRVVKKSIMLAVKCIKPNRKVNLIGKIIQNYIKPYGYSIVKDYCGHGIGRNFHEDPQILHYYVNNNKLCFKKGMVFTIEPMINVGSDKTYTMNDGWTVKTLDGSLSAQYEHTVLVTDTGSKILTL